MPSGRAHETINLVVFGAAAAAYTFARAQGYTARFDVLLAPETATLFTVSYLVGTFLVTPDLDLAENHVRAKRYWGFLGLLWLPYGELFSHRGLSHTWFVGPLTRLLYMVMVGLALSWAAAALLSPFGVTLSVRAQWRENALELSLGALVGYYLSQWLHLVADGVRPDHGSKLRSRGRRRRKGW